MQGHCRSVLKPIHFDPGVMVPQLIGGSMGSTRSRLLPLLMAVILIAPQFLFTQSSAGRPLLLRFPSLSQDRIAFLYASDVWTVSRQGGEAQRLTSNGAVVAGPYYSPDGSEVAYTAH